VPKLELPEERRLIELQLEQHERLLGQRPKGYRSPAIDLTDHTLSLLEEYGFDWDSSLQGRDFEPYRPRLVTEFDREAGNTFGPALSILEFPVSWYLDDFPEFETFNGNAMIQSHDVVLKRWTDTFDYGYERYHAGLMTFTLHPQTIGRAHHMVMLEKFVRHAMAQPGVWFPTLSELHDCWVDE
jgi:peptidoglycan/xylan/chitin deacetylase (PgdA/CDA1 family)